MLVEQFWSKVDEQNIVHRLDIMCFFMIKYVTAFRKCNKSNKIATASAVRFVWERTKMEHKELHSLRIFLEAIQRENKFLRIALACSIGDGILILPDSVVFEPRFSVSQSGNGVSVSVVEGCGIG